jgi:hypothetical protein
MSTRKGYCRLLAISAAVAVAGVPMAFGQSLESESIVGYTTPDSDGIDSLSFGYVTDNTVASASVNNVQFTGMDGNGDQQTMTFSGWTNSQSDYGQLHNATSVTIGNTYYNANNPDYDPTTGQGSPTSLDSLGFSIFSDTLQFGGVLEAGYQARYIFHLDGSVTGNLTDYEGADIGVTIAGNYEDQAWLGDGTYSLDYATQSYAVNGTTPQDIDVQFSTQSYANMADYPDGSNLSGISDFSNTMTLAGIEMLDANGNLVTGWTVSSASGTQYNQILSTPEPAPAIALGVGVLALIRRRRK